MLRAFPSETGKILNNGSQKWIKVKEIINKICLISPFAVLFSSKDLLSDESNKNYQEEPSDGAQPHKGVMLVLCFCT